MTHAGCGKLSRAADAAGVILQRFAIPHIAVRKAPGVASRAVRPIASRILGNAGSSARNLLVHCAQEMNHLAGFLPELHAAFGDE